jgi:uncharacterized membrane protein YgcG
MFSSQQTDVTSVSHSRRRTSRLDIAGWPLRTRLVAIIIVLLAALALIAGATTQIYLRNLLYSQLDDKLAVAVDPGHGGGNFGDGGGRGNTGGGSSSPPTAFDIKRPFPGAAGGTMGPAMVAAWSRPTRTPMAPRIPNSPR